MDAAQTRAAIERANDLRDRLVRMAYALHFSAADAAALYEQRGRAAPAASGIDQTLRAKRWRVASERALQIVQDWDDDVSGCALRPVPRQQPPSEDAPDQPDVTALADTVVRHLFSAGLRLQSLAQVATPAVRDGLTDVVDEIDQAIRELRSFALTLLDDSAPVPD